MARLHGSVEMLEEVPKNPIAQGGNWQQNLFIALEGMLTKSDYESVLATVNSWVQEYPDAARALLMSERDVRYYLSSLNAPLLSNVLRVWAKINNIPKETKPIRKTSSF